MRSDAVKIIRKRCTYDLYYLGREEVRTIKKCTYSVPRKGGQCRISQKVFKHFPFLADFTERKIIAVRIVSSLNHSSLFVNRKKISVMAVNQELWKLARCISESHNEEKENILYLFSKKNAYTMVLHNVGCHLDNFHTNTACFENKSNFRVEWCDGNPAPWEIGRGGGSTNSEFCYALLDWGKESKHRRQKCINHGIINGTECVSRLRLKDYFVNDPDNIEVVRDIGWNSRDIEKVCR